jgi:transcriptional regulator with XRE-family HTH domain
MWAQTIIQMNKSIIASNLSKVRKHHGWSQEQAAKLMGIRRSTLASYEEARALPPMLLIPKFADVYGIMDWKGIVVNADFDVNDQTKVTSSVSLIEQKFNSLTGKEKSLAILLLNLH